MSLFLFYLKDVSVWNESNKEWASKSKMRIFACSVFNQFLLREFMLRNSSPSHFEKTFQIWNCFYLHSNCDNLKLLPRHWSKNFAAIKRIFYSDSFLEIANGRAFSKNAFSLFGSYEKKPTSTLVLMVDIFLVRLRINNKTCFPNSLKRSNLNLWVWKKSSWSPKTLSIVLNL